MLLAASRRAARRRGHGLPDVLRPPGGSVAARTRDGGGGNPVDAAAPRPAGLHHHRRPLPTSDDDRSRGAGAARARLTAGAGPSRSTVFRPPTWLGRGAPPPARLAVRTRPRPGSSLHTSAPAARDDASRAPPPAPPTPPKPSHWLDRWPAASAWLAAKARALWVAGLAERCGGGRGGHPALAGRAGLVTSAVSARADRIESDLLHALAALNGVSTPARLDSRARAHAQAAALAGATTAVLRPLLRDDAATAAVLAQHLGSAASPAARALLAAAAVVSPDPYGASARRLAGVRADWGGAAPRARLDGGPGAGSTTLTLPGPCVYAAALEAVGAGGGGLPFLAAACCSADGGVLAAGCGDRARYERTAWAGDEGGRDCVLTVSRVRA